MRRKSHISTKMTASRNQNDVSEIVTNFEISLKNKLYIKYVFFFFFLNEFTFISFVRIYIDISR